MNNLHQNNLHQFSFYICSAYIFYKWNDTDTFDSVLEKCDNGEDTIHTEVLFYTDKVVLRKTDCKIFDVTKHYLQMSYKDFANMMNAKDKIDWCGLYDWEVIE